MNRSSLARCVVLCIVAGALLLTIPTAPSQGTNDGIGFSAIAAVVPADDGGWWVLERSLQGQGGVVYRYTEQWEQTDERHKVQLQHGSQFSPVDIVSVKTGGWWILAENGTVYRFGENWAYQGESHSLSHPYFERSLTSGFGLTRANGGGWWVNGDRELFRYTSNWTVANDSVKSTESISGGYPVATAYESEQSLWVLEGYFGTGVARFPLTANGYRIDSNALQKVDADVGRINLGTPTDGYRLHDIVDTPIDLVRTDNRWLVVDADGQVHQFDKYWRYTGVTHQVGSGDTEGTYPGHVVSPAVLIVPLIEGFLWILPGLITVGGILWQFREEKNRSVIVAGIGILTFVYGMAMQPFFLRPAVFIHSQLPFIFTVAVVLLSTYHVYGMYDNTGRVGPLLLAYTPLAIVSVMLLVKSVPSLPS